MLSLFAIEPSERIHALTPSFSNNRGIYVPNDDRWPAHFRGVGIRIEDSVCVQPDGPLVLTTEAVKEVSTFSCRFHFYFLPLLFPFFNLSPFTCLSLLPFTCFYLLRIFTFEFSVVIIFTFTFTFYLLTLLFFSFPLSPISTIHGFMFSPFTFSLFPYFHLSPCTIL